LPPSEEEAGNRFPGYHVMDQVGHWDEATAAVVAERLGMMPDVRFFTPHEEATANALFDQLLNQFDEPRIPVVNLVDDRLANQRTDGWHYETMPPDGEAWKQSLAALDAQCRQQFGADFADASREDQAQILQDLHDRGCDDWQGFSAQQLWSLWTRYACTAFYAHPWAWDEIGFAGPAYPRGYKNLGIDKLEPHEVRDQKPMDPTRQHRHASSGQ
jgi:hypothetical protein